MLIFMSKIIKCSKNSPMSISNSKNFSGGDAPGPPLKGEGKGREKKGREGEGGKGKKEGRDGWEGELCSCKFSLKKTLHNTVSKTTGQSTSTISK